MSSARGKRSTGFVMKGRRTLAAFQGRHGQDSQEATDELVSPTQEQLIAKLTAKNKELSRDVDDLRDKVDDLEFYKELVDQSLDSHKATIQKLEKKNKEQTGIIESQEIKIQALETLFMQMNESDQRGGMDEGKPANEVTCNHDTSTSSDDSDMTPAGVEPDAGGLVHSQQHQKKTSAKIKQGSRKKHALWQSA